MMNLEERGFQELAKAPICAFGGFWGDIPLQSRPPQKA